MEEIKVREYVRTKEGIIDKIDAFNINTNIYHCENGLCIDKESKIAVALKDIKHSKNIIDLIEVGDYVNLERILDISEEYIRTTERIHNKNWLQSNIETILTHEQFEQNSYKV